MRDASDHEGVAGGLGARLSNVAVLSANNTGLSGFPAQSFNVQYSAGTPVGQLWTRALAPLLFLILVGGVVCGGGGRTLAEAQRAFDYWQLEFIKFGTFVKILQ